MNECVEEQCVVCNSYGTLVGLLAEGLTLEDAHAVTVEEIVDSIIDSLAEEEEDKEANKEEIYEQGYEDGFVQAMERVHEFTGNVIKQAKKLNEKNGK